MIKKFKDFFKPNKIEEIEEVQETQEELDNKLFKSIDSNDYNTFTTVIEKGANINKVISDDFGTHSTLIAIIFGWRGSDRDRFKFLKVLFEHKVNVFDIIVEGPHGPFEVDVYGAINKLVFDKVNRKKIIDSLIQNYPNYMEERELRQHINQYNL